MVGPYNSAVLEKARKKAGLSVNQLWLLYFEFGGKATSFELEGFLHNALHLDRYQYNILAHALNERFKDLGQNDAVEYAA